MANPSFCLKYDYSMEYREAYGLGSVVYKLKAVIEKVFYLSRFSCHVQLFVLFECVLGFLSLGVNGNRHSRNI